IHPLAGDRAEISVPREHPPGEAEFWLAGPGGESGRVKLFIDTLPQVVETEGAVTPVLLPAGLWGALTVRGDVDTFSFEGAKGQKVVVDAAAKRIGSKAELTLTLTDATGRLVASNIDFECESDPLIVTTLPAAGKYLLTVTDLQLGASADHYYRLSVGDLPVVTGVYPLALPANATNEVRLVGANLPANAIAKVNAGAACESVVPIDLEKYHARRELKVLVSSLPEVLETEDNDKPAHA